MGPSRRPGALANAKAQSPGDAGLMPPPQEEAAPPACDPNLRDQGQASRVALGTGAPSPQGPQQLPGPVPVPPSVPGAPGRGEELVLHTGRGAGGRGGGRMLAGREAVLRATPGPPQPMQGRVGLPDIQALKDTRRWRPGSGCGKGCRRCGCGEVSTRRLLHAAAQHLVGRDEHDADDEGDGEGADQTLAHACLAYLLVGAGCGHRQEHQRDTKGDSGAM